MRHALPLAALAAALLGLLPAAAVVSPARAAEGLFLSWGDCPLGASTQDLGSACDVNVGGQALVCSFRMPFAADSVLGLEVVLDLQHSAPVLPAWWMFGTGGCRAGLLQASFDFTARTACRDFLEGEATGALQSYEPGQPRGGANQARVRLAAAVLPSLGYATLNATDLYYAAVLTLPNAYTTGVSACEGCSGPACLVLNSILVQRQPGAAGGDVSLTVGGPGNANFATWQGGAGASCAAVPVRSVSWGRLKGFYR